MATACSTQKMLVPMIQVRETPTRRRTVVRLLRVESGQIKITQQVKFALNSARLLPESDGVLQAVLDVLQKHSEITKLSVEGHTDNHGADALNQELSRARAASVVDWLAKHGIDRARLSSVGFGKKRPIDTNDTDQGRQNNRRVEFHIVQGPGAETPGIAVRQVTIPATGPAKPAPAPKPAATIVRP